MDARVLRLSKSLARVLPESHSIKIYGRKRVKIVKEARNMPKKKHKCPICGETFKTLQGLGSHISYVHRRPEKEKSVLEEDEDIVKMRKKITLKKLEKELERLKDPQNKEDLIEKMKIERDKALEDVKILKEKYDNLQKYLNPVYAKERELERLYIWYLTNAPRIDPNCVTAFYNAYMKWRLRIQDDYHKIPENLIDEP